MSSFINILNEMSEKRGFDFSGNKRINNKRNYQIARVILSPTDTKELIQKIRDGEDISENDKNRILTALYVMSKNLNMKGRSDQARDIIRKAGVGVQELENGKMKVVDRQIMSEARKTFRKIYAEHNPEQETKPETKPQEKPEIKPQEKSETKPEQEKEPEESPEYRFPDEPEETQAKKTPKDYANDIKNMAKQANEKIDDIINELKSSNDIMAKNNLQKVLKIKRRMGDELNKLQLRAASEPSSSEYLAKKAEIRSNYYTNAAFGATLKGAIRRGTEGTVQALKQAKEKATETAKRLKKSFYEKPSVERAAATLKRTKERITSAAQRGVEKIASATEKKFADAKYQLIKQQLGDKEAEQYAKTKDQKIYNRAKQKEQNNRTTLRQRINRAKRNIEKPVGRIVGSSMRVV